MRGVVPNRGLRSERGVEIRAEKSGRMAIDINKAILSLVINKVMIVVIMIITIMIIIIFCSLKYLRYGS